LPQRDRAEKDALIFRQIEERERLQRDIKRQRKLASGELMQLRKDVANYREIGHAARPRDHRRSALPWLA
jgi:hypothetical protein